MFSPWFTQSQQFAAPMQQMMTEQLAQLERLTRLLSDAHDVGFERGAAAIDESAKLAKSSLVYAQELGKQWREAGLAAAKQAMASVPGAV